MAEKLIKIDSWVASILADPLSKGPLKIDAENQILVSDYGRTYPIKDGIFDLRLLKNETTVDQARWKLGQKGFERWILNYKQRDQDTNYMQEINGVKEVYEDIPIEGNCLDVGGFQGRLRYFLKDDQPYVCCDPILDVFKGIKEQTNLINAYKCVLEPLNYLCCDAEFLPFHSETFDTVHMRSVLDHFLSPEQALAEAYRVLSSDGALVVGLTVRGGQNGRLTKKMKLKEIVKSIAGILGLERFKDYHIWHPTFKQLKKIIQDSGFRIEKVHWQKGCDGNVVYLLAKKHNNKVS